MERRRPDGLEWSLTQKLEMIRDAGFDGAGVRFFDYQYAREVTDFLRAHNMTWQAHRILDNAWGFHGRVASREQVQIQISFPHHREWLELFMDWWEYGFRSWRRRAPKDATLTFLCELGPKEYAMTGPDGYELSDRWEEAKMMMSMIRALWARLEAEGAGSTARAA